MCMYVIHNVFTECLNLEEHIASPRTVKKDCCEPSSGFWELNPGALKELQVLLVAKTSFQPLQNKNRNKTLILWWASEIPTLVQQDGGREPP